MTSDLYYARGADVTWAKRQKYCTYIIWGLINKFDNFDVTDDKVFCWRSQNNAPRDPSISSLSSDTEPLRSSAMQDGILIKRFHHTLDGFVDVFILFSSSWNEFFMYINKQGVIFAHLLVHTKHNEQSYVSYFPAWWYWNNIIHFLFAVEKECALRNNNSFFIEHTMGKTFEALVTNESPA